MGWYAEINKPSDRVILHLMDIATRGEDRPKLSTPDEFRGFLAAHPEVEAVNVYSGDFPRRPVPVAKADARFVRKLFPTREAKTDA